MQLVSLPSLSTCATDELYQSVWLSGSPALILDTIKRGEDDEDVNRGDLPVRKGRSIILRVYESLGGKARGQLWFDVRLGVGWVGRTNLLEDDGKRFEIRNGPVDIELRAFEVATFRVRLLDYSH